MGQLSEVVRELAMGRGYASLQEVADELEGRGYYRRGEASRVLRGDKGSCALLVQALGEVLGLSEEERRRLHELVLAEGEEQYYAVTAQYEALAKEFHGPHPSLVVCLLQLFALAFVQL